MAKPMSTSVHLRDFLPVFCCCLPVSFGCGCVAQISWKAEGKLPSFATSETIVRIFSRDSRCRSKRLRGRWYTGPIVNWFRPTEKPSMEDKSTPTRNWYKLPQKSRYGVNWAKYTLIRMKILRFPMAKHSFFSFPMGLLKCNSFHHNQIYVQLQTKAISLNELLLQ